MSEEEERDRVVEVARSFIGTPFHDNAAVKGPIGGVDCANFLAMVYQEAEMIKPIEIPNYSPQWYLHHDDERFLDIVRKYAREIEPAFTKSGDLVLYRIGRVFSHGAVIVHWPYEVIHACSMARRVIFSGAFDFELSATRQAKDGKTEFKIFTLW